MYITDLNNRYLFYENTNLIVCISIIKLEPKMLHDQHNINQVKITSTCKELQENITSFKIKN